MWRATERKPKLIILDLKLPKVSGIEVLAKIKSEVKTRYISVVALTSSEEDMALRECYKLGVNSYIVKPLDNVPAIFVSGAIGEDVAVETFNQGAVDYILKDQLFRLVPALLLGRCSFLRFKSKEFA